MNPGGGGIFCSERGLRPWRSATLWLVVLGPLFFVSYGTANWLASLHSDVGTIVFEWERGIPFIAWTIIPYWSIDVLYVVSLYVCSNKTEFGIHARRLITAQIIAVVAFVLFPLEFSFSRPNPTGVPGFLFDALSGFDRPFNQAPSLHIALLIILWAHYRRHLPRWALWPLHAWCALVGVSVLTTYQHHFIDLPTGALLGFLSLWLWPDREKSPLAGATVAIDRKRRTLAACYAAGGGAMAAVALWIGGAVLWFLWPAISLWLVAANYAVIGSRGFQKGADGRLSLASRWLFGPYLLGAWLNSRLWTRGDAGPVAICDGVWLGPVPSRRDAAAFTTVIDLCAELRGRSGRAEYRAFPMLDLIAPDAERLCHIALSIENARTVGTVLVCCALGYSRSAAAVATWLLISGRAATAAEALEQVRHRRKRVVIDEASLGRRLESAQVSV
jgi:membrane-associated phospholipid phosphatase